MSFTVQSTTCPYYIMISTAAVVLVPTPTGDARFAFWAGAIVAWTLFVAYAPVTQSQGDPGSSACCGFILAAIPLGYLIQTGALGPVGVAVAPWVALGVGPLVHLVGFGVYTVYRRASGAHDLAQASRVAPPDLPPYLAHAESKVREAALARLPGCDLGGNAWVSLLLPFFEALEANEDWTESKDAWGVKVLDAALSTGRLGRAQVLAVYARLRRWRFPESDDRVAQALQALEWSDLTPLYAAARERFKQARNDVDWVFPLAIADDRAAARDLAREAFAASCVSGEALLAFGAEDAHSLLEEIVAGISVAEEPRGSSRAIDGIAKLPPALAFPLLAQAMGWDHERALALSFSSRRWAEKGLDALFAASGKAPEAARAFLEAVAKRRASEGAPFEREVWDEVSAAVRAGL